MAHAPSAFRLSLLYAGCRARPCAYDFIPTLPSLSYCQLFVSCQVSPLYLTAVCISASLVSSLVCALQLSLIWPALHSFAQQYRPLFTVRTQYHQESSRPKSSTVTRSPNRFTTAYVTALATSSIPFFPIRSSGTRRRVAFNPYILIQIGFTLESNSDEKDLETIEEIRTAMAGVRDPAFWRRFSMAVRLDEEKGVVSGSGTAMGKSNSEEMGMVQHRYVVRSEDMEG